MKTDSLQSNKISILSRFNVDFWFENQRDYNRFLNSFFTNIELIKDDVSWDSFFMFELIKMKFPDVYRMLYKNNGLLNVYDIDKMVGLSSVNHDTLLFKSILDKVNGDMGLAETVYNLIKEIVSNNRKLGIDNTLFSYDFYKYFNYLVYKKEISFFEFKSSFKSEEWEKNIEKWIEKDFTLDLKNKLFTTPVCYDFGSFIKWIDGVFCFMSKLTPYSESIMLSDLFSSINISINDSLAKIFNEQKNLNEAVVDWLSKSEKYSFQKMCFIISIFNNLSDSSIYGITATRYYNNASFTFFNLLKKYIQIQISIGNFGVSMVIDQVIYKDQRLLHLLIELHKSRNLTWDMKIELFNILKEMIESNNENKCYLLFECISRDANSDRSINYKIHEGFIDYFISLSHDGEQMVTNSMRLEFINQFSFDSIKDYKMEFDRFFHRFIESGKRFIYYDEFQLLTEGNLLKIYNANRTNPLI